jgi:N-acetylglucosaminyl-diphospho-decaprenol L-rhamnosyltransferase
VSASRNSLFDSMSTSSLVLPAPTAGRMAVVVVNWNTRDLLRECLRSALAEAPPQVVVVDNGSTDGSAEMVGTEFPQVVLRVLQTNPGYGAGCNAGIALTRTEYALLLNSDTVLAPGALGALTARLDASPRVAVLGPRILNPDGTVFRSCFPFPAPGASLFLYEPFASLATMVPRLRAEYVGRWHPGRAAAVPWVLGAALAIRRRAVDEVGGFDESYQMYCEEVDLCWRLRARGWETLYAPVTDVLHVGGASTRQQRAAMQARLQLSVIQFHRRHHRGATLRLALGLVRAKAAARLARDWIGARLAGDPVRRAELAEDVDVWRQIIAAATPAAVGR